MYGKWVRVDIGEGFSVLVWVTCTPGTPDKELQERAMRMLVRQVNEKVS